MECPNCYFPNRPSARFCQKCGQPLDAPIPAAATGEPAAAPAASPPLAPPVATMPTAAPHTDGAPAEAEAEAQTPPPSPAPAPPPAVAAPPAADIATEAPPGDDTAAAVSPTADSSAAQPPTQTPAEPASASPALVEPSPVTMNAPAGEAPDQGMAQDQAEAATYPDAAATAQPAQTVAEPPPLPDLPVPAPTVGVGEMIAGRYLVLDVQARDGRVEYVVRDLQMCQACQQRLVNPADKFCDNCGASLEDQRLALAATAIQDGQVVQEPAPLSATPALAPAAPPAPRPLRQTVAARTHPGQERELNEDSLSVFTATMFFETKLSEAVGLYVVADGMGGHEGGEVASRLAVHAISGVILPETPRLAAGALDGAKIAAVLTRAVLEANQHIFDAAQARGSDMGSTVTLALVIRDTAYIANVGDSRTYHWAGNLLRRVTNDHSLVWRLVGAGQMTEDEIYTHDMRNYIYRNLGAKPTLEVDIFVEPLAPGARLLLCSDGLWEMVRNDGIEMILNATAAPQAACDMLIDRANAAGGEDNITVIVVQIDADP